MATESILKTIIISDKDSGSKIVNALEKAKFAPSKVVKLNKKVENVGKGKILKLFRK